MINVETISRENFVNFCLNALSEKAQLDYLKGKNDEYFGLYPDGTYCVGANIGEEINPNERPVLKIKCNETSDEDIAEFEAYHENDLRDGLIDLMMSMYDGWREE